MNNQSDGGAAFPRIEHICLNEKNDGWGEVHTTKGMTLRDWFAGMALQGSLACPTPGNQWQALADALGKTIPDTVAHQAYLLADSMLAARAGKEQA